MNTSTGRNDACPCGSGRKYKKCCLGHDEKVLREQRQQERAEDTEHEHGPGCSHGHDEH